MRPSRAPRRRRRDPGAGDGDDGVLGGALRRRRLRRRRARGARRPGALAAAAAVRARGPRGGRRRVGRRRDRRRRPRPRRLHRPAHRHRHGACARAGGRPRRLAGVPTLAALALALADAPEARRPQARAAHRRPPPRGVRGRLRARTAPACARSRTSPWSAADDLAGVARRPRRRGHGRRRRRAVRRPAARVGAAGRGRRRADGRHGRPGGRLRRARPRPRPGRGPAPLRPRPRRRSRAPATPGAARRPPEAPREPPGRPRRRRATSASCGPCTSPTSRPSRRSRPARSRCPGRWRSSAASSRARRGICLVCEDDGRIVAYLIADMFVDVWHLMNLCVAEEVRRQHVASRAAGGLLRDHRAQGAPRPHARGARVQHRRPSSSTAASGSSPPASAPATTATTARTRSSCGRTGRGTRRDRDGAAQAPPAGLDPRRRDVLRRHQRGRRARARGALVHRLVAERAARAVRRRGAGGGLTPPHGARQRGRRRGDEPRPAPAGTTSAPSPSTQGPGLIGALLVGPGDGASPSPTGAGCP